jgi:hypothetical protein
MYVYHIQHILKYVYILEWPHWANYHMPYFTYLSAFFGKHIQNLLN